MIDLLAGNLGPTTSNRRDQGTLLGLLLFAALIRAAVLIAGGVALDRDPDSYRRYAETFVEQGTFLRDGQPSAWRPPLYPILLSVCLALPGSSLLWIEVLHAVAGIATVWLAWAIGRMWNLRHGALGAGFLIAVDPILMYQSTQLMTETVAALLATLVLLLAARTWQRASVAWALTTGIAIGLAILCRPTFLPWAILLSPVMGCVRGCKYQPRLVAMFFLAAVITLAPWAIRNARTLGRPIVTTTHGGYTLLLANNRYFYEFLRQRKRGEIWDSSRFVADWKARLKRQNVANEIEEDQFAYRLARQSIADNPPAFVRACLYRITSFWRLAPRRIGNQTGITARIIRLATTFWYFALFGLALLGLLEFERQQRPHTWAIALLLAIALSAAHALYWSDMRMRAPLMPAVALFAAAGWRWLGNFRRRRSSRDTKT